MITMSEPHKRSYRHPKYKTGYHVKNWPEYERSLRDRGDITLWLSQDATDVWTPPKTERQGGQRIYSDIAIETALTLRLVFHLPLRQMEGFFRSILELMGLDFPCPDHPTVSRRNRAVNIRHRIDQLPKGPVCLIVDSTGLMMCGEGEWHSKKHGEKWRKRWKKLHIGVDGEEWIFASSVTDCYDPDPSQVPGLLSQVDREINCFVGDGIYDQESVYGASDQHSPGVSVIIPPRKDAVLSSEAATSPTPRDAHIVEIQSEGRFKWKRESGYYRQSHAENVFFRYNTTFGGRLRAKKEEAQEREVALGCALLNRIREMGRPQSYPVG